MHAFHAAEVDKNLLLKFLKDMEAAKAVVYTYDSSYDIVDLASLSDPGLMGLTCNGREVAIWHKLDESHYKLVRAQLLDPNCPHKLSMESYVHPTVEPSSKTVLALLRGGES
ncbi:MAG: hypothetical protein DRJ62_04250 [Thermoprotei archaeon]|nr:MAG: hypothetical protein DRJ62_04250 [Thermoprotei archaeon]